MIEIQSLSHGIVESNFTNVPHCLEAMYLGRYSLLTTDFLFAFNYLLNKRPNLYQIRQLDFNKQLSELITLRENAQKNFDEAVTKSAILRTYKGGKLCIDPHKVGSVYTEVTTEDIKPEKIALEDPDLKFLEEIVSVQVKHDTVHFGDYRFKPEHFGQYTYSLLSILTFHKPELVLYGQLALAWMNDSKSPVYTKIKSEEDIDKLANAFNEQVDGKDYFKIRIPLELPKDKP
ncbi:MAG: hypothetical protein ABH828_06380 [archaeon]